MTNGKKKKIVGPNLLLKLKKIKKIIIKKDKAPPTYLIFNLSFPAALPLLEDLGQLVQAGVMEVEDLILALSTGDHKLATSARLITATTQ